MILESQMRKIVTTCVCPPIPDRRNDWCAHYDGDEESGDIGWGATEADAIADFRDNYQDEADLRIDGKCACPYCFESSGYEARDIPATYYEPAWQDTDYTRPCEHCHGTGVYERPAPAVARPVETEIPF